MKMMKKNQVAFVAAGILGLAAILSLAACGGGGGGAEEDPPVSQPPSLSYTDKVFALGGKAGSLYMVTKGGITPVINQTSHQTGVYKLLNCTLPQSGKTLADGHVLSECAAADDGKRHWTKIDPSTGVQTDYSGPIPADMTFVNVESNSTQPVAHTTSCRVAGGWYYVDPRKATRIVFRPDTGAEITVRDGDFATDGNINLLRVYSH